MTAKRKASRLREYSPKVAALLTLGFPDAENGDWHRSPLADYRAMGIGDEYLPELAALCVDRAAVDGPEPVYLGPVHAARALRALRTMAGTPALIDAVRLSCTTEFDFWTDDLSGKYGLAVMGPAIIDPVCLAARDQRENLFVRIALIDVLEQLVESPEHGEGSRDRVVPFLRDLLKTARFNDPSLNGFVISKLAELRTAEALPEIRAAFETENRPGRPRSGVGGVDEHWCGRLEAVERRMGMTDADRLRERIAWAESYAAEIKQMLAGGAEEEAQVDGEFEAEPPLNREEDLAWQEKRVAELKAELRVIEAGEV